MVGPDENPDRPVGDGGTGTEADRTRGDWEDDPAPPGRPPGAQAAGPWRGPGPPPARPREADRPRARRLPPRRGHFREIDTPVEHRGIIRHGAKLIYAYAEATVPLPTVVPRKAYVGAYIVMGSSGLGADATYAWSGAELAVLGPRGAVDILYRDELAAADDTEARRAELEDRFREEFANPYGPAKHGPIDDVIEPAETRRRLVADLRLLERKRTDTPPKDHGNLPL